MKVHSSWLALVLAACGAPAATSVEEAPTDEKALAVGTEPEVCDGQCAPLHTDIMSSFVVTDRDILDRFPLRRVLDQLTSAAGVGNNADDVWRQWWSSQRVRQGGDPAHHPFCDDADPLPGQINGFDITCPRDESLLEHELLETHAPVALFNRFDLAPMDGAHCGEYRIVYALGGDDRSREVQANAHSPEVQSGRNFIIFEGVLPNPHPECELAGCLPVAEFWQSLSTEPDVHIRADLLEQFYFDGICDFKPVVLPENYGLDCRDGSGYGGACGQIRTNQFIEREWNLREFTLLRNEEFSELIVEQTTVAQNPHVSLWDSSHPNYPSFESDLVGQLSRQMPVPDGVNVLGAATSPRFDAGESVSQFGGFNFNLYDADPVLEAAIMPHLLPAPSTVGVVDIEERMTTQSCGGCHELSNSVDLEHTQGFSGVVWPNTLGFVHVDENSNLSPALLNEFLPHRQQVMADYLAATCGNDCFSEASGVKLVKEVMSSDQVEGEPIVTFRVVDVEEWYRLQEQGLILTVDTLSGSLVH